MVGGGPAGAARSAEREEAGGLQVRSHFNSELGREAQQHRASPHPWSEATSHTDLGDLGGDLCKFAC